MLMQQVAGRLLEIDSTGRNKNLCTMDANDGGSREYARCFLEMDRGDGVLQEYGPDM